MTSPARPNSLPMSSTPAMVTTGGILTCRSMTSGATKFASMRWTPTPSAGAERLAQAERAQGEQRRQEGENSTPKNGHDGGHPGEDAERQEVRHSQGPEAQRREGGQQDHRDDLAHDPGPDRSVTSARIARASGAGGVGPGPRPRSRRRRMARQEDRHHEDADAFDQELDPALEIRDRRPRRTRGSRLSAEATNPGCVSTRAWPPAGPGCSA